MSKLIKKLTEGVVHVTFKKADGTIREMDATLCDYLLPEVKNTRAPNDEVVVVFSLDDNAWRSFRKDRLIDWSVYD